MTVTGRLVLVLSNKRHAMIQTSATALTPPAWFCLGRPRAVKTAPTRRGHGHETSPWTRTVDGSRSLQNHLQSGVTAGLQTWVNARRYEQCCCCSSIMSTVGRSNVDLWSLINIKNLTNHYHFTSSWLNRRKTTKGCENADTKLIFCRNKNAGKDDY